MCNDQEPEDLGYEKYQRQLLFELKWANTVVTTNFVVLILIALFAHLYLWQVLPTDNWYFLVCFLLTSGWLVSAFIWARTTRQRLESEATHRIISSGIIERLAGGTDWIEDIYRFTVWPWTLIGLGARPRQMKGWIRLLAMNLDWFLEKPRTLFRIEWLAILFFRVFPFVFIASLFAGFFRVANSDVLHAGIKVLVSAFSIAGIVMFPSLYRRRMACATLHKLMSERFDA